jgi:hypothetical protein
MTVHTCERPKVKYDYREDKTWDPPQQERRPRCVICGWQGKWRKTDGISG